MRRRATFPLLLIEIVVVRVEVCSVLIEVVVEVVVGVVVVERPTSTQQVRWC
jgi:hypothetical protein